MKETEALLGLQKIDLELMRYAKTLRAMPQTKKIDAAKLARKKIASQLAKIVGQRKDCEMEIADNETEHQRMADKTTQIQAAYEGGQATYREVQDLERNLTSLAKHREKLEFSHRELEAQLDKLKLAENNARAVDDRLQEEIGALEESFRQDTADIAAKVAELKQEREHCLRNMSDGVKADYEVAFKRFGGLAVERLNGNVPSICHVQLQPSQFGDIKKGPEITECPYCHRMLVTEDMFGDGNGE